MTQSDHLDDPLDYLYEELPPAEMAWAREHLAACPRCREEFRRVRETVKAYRQAPAPVPPAGLAGRTADYVLRQMHADLSAAAAAEDAASSESAAGDTEYSRLRQEVMEELRPRRVRWFLHPAWSAAVAASVFFGCALLIHFSPRSGLWYSSGHPAYEAAVPRSLPDLDFAAEPLPPPLLPSEAAPPAYSAPPPELLRGRAAAEAPDLQPQSTPPPSAPLNAAPAFRQAPPVLARSAAPKEVPAEVTAEAAADTAAAPDTLTQREASSESMVLFDGFSFDEPPQLIARPTPIDTEKLARDLGSLAGMQIGSGEIADAWITIGMLRRYDPRKADELSGILREMEKAALAGLPPEEDGTAVMAGTDSAAEVPETEAAGNKAGAAVTAEPSAVPDKYYVPAQPEEMAAPPSGLRPPPAAAATPEAVPEIPAPAEALTPPDTDSLRESVPLPVPQSDAAGRPESFAEPEAAASAPAPPEESVLQPALAELFPEPPSPPPPAAAPEVPKSSRQALPPTLWEYSGSNERGQRNAAPRRQRPFTTDPYYRDH